MTGNLPAAPRRLPGMGLDDLLAAHVAHLRLLRRADRTIYERQRAVIRLAAWLGARYAGTGSGPQGAPGGPGFLGPEALPGRLILTATAADLAAWRASLTVGDRALLTYTCHVREFYRFAVREGFIEVSPAEGLP